MFKAFALIVSTLGLLSVEAKGRNACDGMSRRQCEELLADMQATAEFLKRKARENSVETDKALNKCVAKLPEDFTGRDLRKCMAKYIGH